MIIDGINLVEGTKIVNSVVNSGSSFPSNPDAGELFFRTDESKLYVYSGSTWNEAGSGGGVNLEAIVMEKSVNVPGTLSVMTGNIRWYPVAPVHVTGVQASVGTPPTGSAVTVRLNKNGSSVGTNSVAAGSNLASATSLDVTTVAGDYFTLDVTAVGSSTSGSDLSVNITYTRV